VRSFIGSTFSSIQTLPLTVIICSTACRGDIAKYDWSMYGEIARLGESK
jgi:hypothetical protein